MAAEPPLLYYVCYKPYNVINQFSKAHPDHISLQDILKVPKDIYPVGRLDKDSEGLLLLTNDKSVNTLLLQPQNKKHKTYLVQVDGDITHDAVLKLSRGIEIKLDTGPYMTRPCEVKKLKQPPVLPDRNPPIRMRLHIPTSWIKITLTEGKNRQIRKMCAQAGFPVLRLVRVQIQDLKIGILQPGELKKMTRDTFFDLLQLPKDAPIKKPVVQERKITLKGKRPVKQKNHVKNTKSNSKYSR